MSPLPRGLTLLLGAAGIVVAIYGIQAMSGILGPFFLALMLVITVSPVQRKLAARGVPRWAGTVCVLILLYAILLGLLAVIGLSIGRLATILPTYADKARDLVDAAERQLESLGIGSEQTATIIERIDPNQVIDTASAVLASLAGIGSNLLFLILLVLFLGMDSATMPTRMEAIARYRPGFASAMSSFATGTRRYLWVSTLFGAIVAVIDGVALAWIGVPLPILWALLSFITNYIPNIGFFLGLIPPALLGLLEGGVGMMVLVIIAYCAINFVVQTIIQPKFLGDSVGLTVTMTFLGLTFWTWALGALGALLAIPLTLLTKAMLFDIDPSSRWVNLLIEGKPGELTPATVGAGAREEASETAQVADGEQPEASDATSDDDPGRPPTDDGTTAKD